jgi:long-chain fatty acid transport protein
VAHRAGAVALALGASPFLFPAVHAQGFGLTEIGTCAVARAGAVTGAPCEDASVVYWNPAAAASLPRGRQAYVGGSAIAVKGGFTQDVTGREFPGDVPVEFPPFVGATWTGGRTHAVSFGLAAYVPYGLTSQWGDDFIGRFAAQKASLQTVYVQPNIAVELIPGRLAIGGGPILGYSRLELRQALDAASLPVAGTPFTLAQFGVQRETEFARLQVAGDAFGVGANLGVHARLTNTITVGARWLSQVRFNYDGADAEFTPSPQAADYVLVGGLPPAVPPGTTLAQLTQPQFQPGGAFGPGQTASTRIDHPSQFQVGVGYTGLRGTTISADYARTDWRSFYDLPVNFTTAAGTPSPLSRTLIEAYEPSDSYRASIEHKYRSGFAARLGAMFATTPAPDVTVTPLLPDMDRFDFSGGLAIPLGRFVLDAGYLRVETRGRRGRTGERPDLSLPAEQINNGWYALNANVFSLSLKARF